MRPQYRFAVPEGDSENSKFKLGNSCPRGEINDKKLDPYYPSFSFDLIDIEKITNYHFHQDEFDKSDIAQFFLKLKKICGKTYNELNESREKEDIELHFKIDYNPRGRIKDLLNEVYKKLYPKRNSVLKDEQIPIIGHFALYTSKDVLADRKTGVKSPRIFFSIHQKAQFYLLFYDPYHEIQGTKNNK